jgi:membrane-associated phospholipid phosphatase
MALARVVAGEYPRWYVASTAYAFAETVSICRVLARDHFPSDVLVGQSIGFLTGNYVLNHRALYRPGKSGAVARILSTATPIVDPATHTTGLALSIPVGR